MTTLLGLVVSLAFCATQVCVFVGFAAAHSSLTPATDLVQLTAQLATSGLLMAVAQWASTAVCVTLLVVMIQGRRGALVSRYLALRPVDFPTLLRLLVLAAGLVAGWDWFTLVTGRRVVPQYMLDAYHIAGWLPLFWGAVILAAPAFEEVFFRGFLLQGWRAAWFGDWGAILLTAALWASMHFQCDAYEKASVFAAGLLLGAVRLRTGSLWACLAMHAFYNLVATIELDLCVRGLWRG